MSHGSSGRPCVARLAAEGASQDWKFYGASLGWQLKVSKGKRAVVYLIPHEQGGFLAALALKGEALDAVAGMDLPAQPAISPLVNIVAPQPQRAAGLTNAATVHRLHALFSRGCLDEVLELVASEVQVDFVASGQLIVGRAGFRGLLSVFKSAFPDLIVRDRCEIATGDHVVVESDWTGTNLGRISILGRTIEPTGKRVEHGRFIEVYRLWNGRVVAMTNYQDPSGWMRELGIPGAASLAPIVEKHPIAAWISVTRPDLAGSSGGKADASTPDDPSP